MYKTKATNNNHIMLSKHIYSYIECKIQCIVVALDVGRQSIDSAFSHWLKVLVTAASWQSRVPLLGKIGSYVVHEGIYEYTQSARSVLHRWGSKHSATTGVLLPKSCCRLLGDSNTYSNVELDWVCFQQEHKTRSKTHKPVAFDVVFKAPFPT